MGPPIYGIFAYILRGLSERAIFCAMVSLLLVLINMKIYDVEK